MKKYIFKIILFLVIIFLILIMFSPYVASSLLKLKKQRDQELTAELVLQGQLAEEKAFNKREEETQEKNYLMGKFDPSIREDFAQVPEQLTIDGSKMYLRKETLDAFLKMEDMANKSGVKLGIASATRNFDYQKDFWNKQWSRATIIDGQDLSSNAVSGLEKSKKILEYIAVPGTSRHHWGTDIDISGDKAYAWLADNAWKFGFCQTYNQKGLERKDGYNEENWHWSYLPLSENFTEEYKNLIKNEDIKGFSGDEYIAGQDLINNYVLSINPDCI